MQLVFLFCLLDISNETGTKSYRHFESSQADHNTTLN
jgi:hypothetical protein